MSLPWWDLLGDYILTRGEILKAISYLSYAKHLGWRNPTQPLSLNGRWTSRTDESFPAERTLTERQSDWEDHLQLHSTTKLSPYEVLFGRNPPSL